MRSLPTGPTQVTKTGNVGSVDVFREAHLTTFGLRGKGNCMPSLPIVPTQVALRGNVGSLDAPRASQLFTFGPREQGIALRGS